MTYALEETGHRRPPVRLLVHTRNDLVRAGVRTMLSAFPDRVVVVEPQEGDALDGWDHGVDVVLHDALGGRPTDLDGIDVVLARTGAPCVVCGPDPSPEPGSVVDDLLRSGASYVSAGSDREDLVAAVEAAAGSSSHRGDSLWSSTVPTADGADWPGRREGLSYREAQVVTAITRGLTNQQIADRSFLSINSVKTYVRTAYRKIGVQTRSQAVIWGVHHGLGLSRTGASTDDADVATVPSVVRRRAASAR